VIEIMNDSDPYPTLLGINSAFNNNVVLNLKKRHMSFETDTLQGEHLFAEVFGVKKFAKIKKKTSATTSSIGYGGFSGCSI